MSAIDVKNIEGYTFKESNASDIPAALAMRAKLFREMGVAPEALLDNSSEKLRETYDSAYRDDEIVHYFAYSGGEIASVAGALIKRDFPYVFFKPGYYGWIIDVFTEPEHRGRGLALKLIEMTHAWLVSKGVCEAKLISAGVGPRRIYERLGYRPTWEMSLNLGNSGALTYNEYIDAHSTDS